MSAESFDTSMVRGTGRESSWVIMGAAGGQDMGPQRAGSAQQINWDAFNGPAHSCVAHQGHCAGGPRHWQQHLPCPSNMLLGREGMLAPSCKSCKL